MHAPPPAGSLTIDITGDWYFVAATPTFVMRLEKLGAGRVSLNPTRRGQYEARVEFVFAGRPRRLRLRIPAEGLDRGQPSFRTGFGLPVNWTDAPRSGWTVSCSPDGTVFSARKAPALMSRGGALVLARAHLPAPSAMALIARHHVALGLVPSDLEVLRPIQQGAGTMT